MIGPNLVALVVCCVAVSDQTILAQRQNPPKNDARRDPDDFSNVFRNIAGKSRSSLVSVEAFGRASRHCRSPGPFHTLGSGFVTDSGVILTNAHLVSGADRVVIRTRDGDELVASRVDIDPLTDLAVVRLTPPLNIAALPMADSDTVAAGDWVVALGNSTPDNSPATGTIAAGIVNSIGPGPGMTRREDFLQVNNTVDSTNSGGPLLNLNGEVVGVNTVVNDDDGLLSPSPGYAIPSNLVNWVSRQLIEKGTVSRAFLGLRSQPINKRLAEQFNTPVGEGALVTQVQPNSPAAMANLKPNDIILKVNDQKIVNPHQFQGLMERLLVGKTYPLEVWRDGKRINVDVVPVEMTLPAKFAPRTLRLLSPSTVTPTLETAQDSGISAHRAVSDVGPLRDAD